MKQEEAGEQNMMERKEVLHCSRLFPRRVADDEKQRARVVGCIPPPPPALKLSAVEDER